MFVSKTLKVINAGSFFQPRLSAHSVCACCAVVEMVSTHGAVHDFMIMRGSVILGNSIVFNKPTLEGATSHRRQDTENGQLD